MSPPALGSFAFAHGSSANSSGKTPAFPVWSAIGRTAQRRSADIDTQDLAGMRDDQIADPLRDSGAACGHGMLHRQRLVQRTPLGVREAHEGSVAPWMREPRASDLPHPIFDITISGRQKQTRPRACGSPTASSFRGLRCLSEESLRSLPLDGPEETRSLGEARRSQPATGCCAQGTRDPERRSVSDRQDLPPPATLTRTGGGSQ
jgi:hypothetical protein